MPCTISDPSSALVGNRTVVDDGGVPNRRILKTPHRYDLRPGDLLTVTLASVSPGLVGDVFTIVGEEERSYATYRRFVIRGASWLAPRIEVRGTRPCRTPWSAAPSRPRCSWPSSWRSPPPTWWPSRSRTRRTGRARTPRPATTAARGGPSSSTTGPGEVSWSAGTDRAQANRLEYGFVGTDSLGRTYDQPPYEHHGPAVDVIEPIFHAAMEKVAQKATAW
jgi:hypothetical protein